MAKKQKLAKTDGLGPLEIKKIRSAIRLVWHRSHARSMVVRRCTGFDGYFRCETCGAKTPVLKVDHIKAVGDVDAGFIARLFCSSKQLQGMCTECHNKKTAEERKVLRERNKKKGVR